jgi:oligopeptide transport system permease protein
MPRSLALSSLRARASSRWSLRFLVALTFIAIIVPFLPLLPPAETNLRNVLHPPSFDVVWTELAKPHAMDLSDPVSRGLFHLRQMCFDRSTQGPILGTDSLGLCILSRLLWGARLSLGVGFVATALSLLIGVLYGGIAGYARGRTDQLMMRFVDVLYSLPLMFMVMFIVAIIRGARESNPDFEFSQILVLFLVIGAISWLTLARMVRSQVLSLRETEFVLASVAAGATPGQVLVRHLLPNVMPVILVTLTLTVPRVMLFEAYLSFLGLGVESPDVSWGLLARQGFDAMTAVHSSPWLIVVPGLAFALTLLSMNLLGDGLRDALDPRLRQRGSS